MQIVRWAALASALSVCACASAISGSADSVSRLEAARSSHPNSEPTIRNLGIAYFKATPQRLSDARDALSKAVAMDPKDGVAALYLGLTAEAQNDLAAAKTAYQSYLAVGKTRGVKNQIEARLATIARQENAANAKLAVAQEQARTATPGPRTTVAVMPFVFSGSDTSLKPLERGLAELIVTDLSQARSLKVVERAQLQALLNEIQLQQAAGVQTGTGVRAGKILQAGSLVGGQISQLGANQLNTSATVTSVQTAQPLGSGFNGQSQLDQVFDVEKRIVFQVITDLGVQLSTAERNAIEQRPTRSLAAFLAYSRGLTLEDQGQYDAAGREFDNAFRADPGFITARDRGQQAHDAAAGASVTVGTVESGLRGTSEGAIVAAASNGATSAGSTVNIAASIAEGLNPSVAGGATAGNSTSTQPRLDASAGTGADNPTTKSARVTIVITAPRP